MTYKGVRKKNTCQQTKQSTEPGRDMTSMLKLSDNEFKIRSMFKGFTGKS